MADRSLPRPPRGGARGPARAREEQPTPGGAQKAPHPQTEGSTTSRRGPRTTERWPAARGSQRPQRRTTGRQGERPTADPTRRREGEGAEPPLLSMCDVCLCVTYCRRLWRTAEGRRGSTRGPHTQTRPARGSTKTAPHAQALKFLLKGSEGEHARAPRQANPATRGSTNGPTRAGAQC